MTKYKVLLDCGSFTETITVEANSKAEAYDKAGQRGAEIEPRHFRIAVVEELNGETA